MYKVDVRKIVVGMTVCFGLAACNGGADADQASNQQLDGAEVAQEVADAAPVAMTIEELVVGTYVEDGTYAIGGTGTQFSKPGALFANVKWNGDASASNLTVKLVDATGAVVAEKAAAAIQAGESSANFSLWRAKDEQFLAPGNYRLDVYADSELKRSADINIAE
ncbi:FlgD immunoglobulin-like domain containing protein [Stenotrophomonas sp.]|uniref:FlgD immunoglobulin-like domain containing protein n=1 Tax=Stenotrophomonas sp. TaxID=69392 RepID=UPI0028A98AC0|nr:FlgD immunoglobulin-like domain containing protein [Stenotrophomonas sp.]